MAVYNISPTEFGIVGFEPYQTSTPQEFTSAHAYQLPSQYFNLAEVISPISSQQYNLSINNDWTPFNYGLQQDPTFSWSSYRTFLFFNLVDIISELPITEAIYSIYLKFTSTDTTELSMKAYKSTAFGGISNGPNPAPLVSSDFNEANFARPYSDFITPTPPNSIENYSVSLNEFAIGEALSNQYLSIALVSQFESAFIEGNPITTGARGAFGINWNIIPQLEITTVALPQNVYKGFIFHTHFYNKSLTPTEVTQNFNSIKRRFIN